MSTPFGFNGSRQIIDLQASGTLTAILATGPLRRLKIYESLLTAEGAANTPVGLLYTLPGSSQTFEVPAPSTTNEPGDFPSIDIPGEADRSFHAAYGNILGNGPDMPGAGVAPRLATTLCSVSSATAAATAIVVEQYY